MTTLSLHFWNQSMCEAGNGNSLEDLSFIIEEATTAIKVKELVSEQIGIHQNRISLIVEEPIKATRHTYSCCWERSTQIVGSTTKYFEMKDSALVLKSMQPYCGDFYYPDENPGEFIVEDYGPRKLYFAIPK